MIIRSILYLVLSLRALERSSPIPRAWVSSNRIRMPARVLTASLRRTHSSSRSLPARTILESSFDSATSRRMSSCSLGISRLKNAMEALCFSAIFRAMVSTKAVFPIEGRAAMMMRSPFCQPWVISSRLSNPVGRPLSPCSSSLAFSMFSITRLRTNSADSLSFFAPNSWSSNTRCSASSIRSSTSACPS